MNHSTETPAWDREIADLLEDLSSVQEELLDVLGEKRRMLAEANNEGIAGLAPREQTVLARLEACHQRRSELLERAKAEGLPSDSIHSLTEALPGQRERFGQRLVETSARARLLQHHSLSTWVLAQRAVLHLSQMLEILATGGQTKPTYEKNRCAPGGGTLIDQSV